MAVLSIGSENNFGLTTFLILYVARVSAKLNLFFGVPYINLHFLTAPLFISRHFVGLHLLVFLYRFYHNVVSYVYIFSGVYVLLSPCQISSLDICC